MKDRDRKYRSRSRSHRYEGFCSHSRTRTSSRQKDRRRSRSRSRSHNRKQKQDNSTNHENNTYSDYSYSYSDYSYSYSDRSVSPEGITVFWKSQLERRPKRDKSTEHKDKGDRSNIPIRERLPLPDLGAMRRMMSNVRRSNEIAAKKEQESCQRRLRVRDWNELLFI